MPISSVGRTGNRRGVTLIEMVVVVAIIGVIVAVSLPSATAGIDSVRLASATGSVASFLNAAVNRTERRQIPMEVVIEPKQNRLSVYSEDPGYTRELKMPDGITIEAVLAGQPVSSEDGERAPFRLLLVPGASTPGIGVQLANQHGSRRIVRLDPMTGFPRVESVTPNSTNNR
ncbi:MAG: prepilin-type N-terminal cleavage/methylation domain-containing protein [Candidatus Sulfopaludibacter sp.]|nr:prepilin-type N-terminal cleavage/methylation domain-containing protein [Candidatus Sulfopaludibacter sp.]